MNKPSFLVDGVGQNLRTHATGNRHVYGESKLLAGILQIGDRVWS
ncbi:MAG: hypothetical protein ACE5JF_12860 [Anaerolineales bacterium]